MTPDHHGMSHWTYHDPILDMAQRLTGLERDFIMLRDELAEQKEERRKILFWGAIVVLGTNGGQHSETVADLLRRGLGLE